MRLTDHTDDLRQQRFPTDSFGAHDETARSIDRRPYNFVAGLLLHRERLAGDHRFIDGACPFQYHAIHGNLFARSNA